MVWVFGYGSLVWKAGFPYLRKMVGFVKGYVRRFYWWSLDHRGVPGAPGRVVNLLKSDAEDEVWGVAYEIADEVWRRDVEAKLDHREKGGYKQSREMFYPREVDGPNEAQVEVVVYIGSVSGAQFAGPAPVEEMAATVLKAEGPSGTNREYLYNLANALRKLDIHDPHVYELEGAVQELEESIGKKEKRVDG